MLIVPTGTYRAEEYLSAAGRMGIRVVTASERAQALADVMGAGFLELPLDDPDRAAAAIVEHATKVPLDAVIAVDDQGLLAAAAAGERLGLRHNPLEAVRLTRDKAAMRRAFARSGVPQPRFEVVAPSAAAAAAQRLGPPVVVKPPSLSASRGVIRANSPDEATAAARRAAAILEEAGEDTSLLVVETFVPGREVAVEGICRDGNPHVIGVFDKPDPLDGPYFEESIYVAPSRLGHDLVRDVEDTARRSVRALGLTDGPFHAELRVPPSARPGGGDLKVLEVAARTIGGRCSKAMELEGGWSLEQLVIANALGEDPPAPVLARPCGVLMMRIPHTGVLRRVNGVEDVRAIAGVTGVEVTIPVGRTVRTLPEGDRYLGFVFASGDSPEAVEDALRQADARLEVVVERGRDAADGTVA